MISLSALLLALGACADGFTDPKREYGPAVEDSTRAPDEIHVPTGLGVWNSPLEDDPELPQSAACETCHGPTAAAVAGASPGEAFHTSIDTEHGTLRCNQCHDADRTWLHLADGKQVAFDEVMTLCRQCHGPQTRDYNHGSHGGNSGYWDDRQGAAVRNNCVDCHDPHAPAFSLYQPVFPPQGHGEPADEAESPAVPQAPTYAEQRGDAPEGEVAKSCTDCHEARTTEAGRGGRHEHPVGVKLPRGADLVTLAALGGRTGTDDEGNRLVQCRTCHRPHNLEQEAELVDGVESGKLCVTCHREQRHGASAHPVTGAIDPALRATVAKLGGNASALGCLSCHDAHESTSATLLRTTGTGNAACRDCHEEQDHAVAGAGHGGNDCQDCHGDHARPAHSLSQNRAADPSDQFCYECHGPDGEATTISTKKGHPIWKAMTATMQASGHDGLVGCTDCHTPHADADKLPFLLTAGGFAATCTSCHADKSTVLHTDHDAAEVAVGDVEESCVSCHSVHGSNKPPAAPKGVNPASGRCLSCHDGRVEATKIDTYTHPTGLLLTAGGLPARYDGPVPYYAPSGLLTTDREVGEITCQTCHDPHRWKHDADQKPGEAKGSEQDSFLREPASVIEFCSVCHGVDARPRFRFFHQASFRDEISPKANEAAPPAAPGGTP